MKPLETEQPVLVRVATAVAVDLGHVRGMALLGTCARTARSGTHGREGPWGLRAPRHHAPSGGQRRPSPGRLARAGLCERGDVWENWKKSKTD